MGEQRHAIVQQQARALGDPTRHEIFRLVEASTDGREQQRGGVTLPAGGLSVKALAAALSLHQSAVRQHLAKLVEAQLVIAEVQPADGPGRPRSTYRRTPLALGTWGALNPFERLSALLLDLLAGGLSPRDTGRRVGRHLADSPDLADTEGVPALVRAMEAQGFDPVLETSATGVDVVLRQCPVASLALTARDVVCGAHQGIAEGLVGGDGEPADAQLLDVDPMAGGCRLRFDSVHPQNP